MQKDYEELFESIPCGILQMELPFRNTCQVYRINPRAEEIMKTHLESGDVMEAGAYLDDDNLKYAREILKKLKKPGDQSHFLLKTHNSAIEGDVRLIRLENGHELLQCMFMEVGEEVEARKREARQKELLEQVLASVRCGILRFTFENGEQRITLVNPAGWKLLGFASEDECLHRSLNDLLPRIHPEDQILVLKQYCSLVRENDRAECEFRVLDGAGGYRRLDAVMQCLRDTDGSQLTQVTLTDITFQHQLIQQKKREDEQIILSLGAVYFTILQVDVKNDSYRVIKDDIHGELMQKNGCYSEVIRKWQDFWKRTSSISVESINLSLDFFREIYRQGKTFWEQDYSRNSARKISYFRMTLLFSGDGKELSYVTVAVRDITELHKKEIDEREALRSACEASRQASRAKTEFLSNMSHDIRTPMNAIVGFAQIMERHLDSPEIVKENIVKIRRSSQVLLDLINDVLDVSRIESGKMLLEEQPVDLKKLAEEVLDMVRPSVEKHSHQLSTSLEFPEELFLADDLRLRQILMNLLSNAVKFTPDGGQIWFSAWEDSDDDGGRYKNIHFQVKDNGIGMSEEFLEHLFEPFERARETSAMQGTGLGMTITRNLIHLMNGIIEVTSEHGKGSCFDIMIPMKAVRSGKIPERSPEKNSAVPDWSGHTILVVEDNELNMEITCTFLRETGASLETASNGKEAVEKLEASENGHYSLILMDVQMPVMNGYEATRAIRQSDHPDGASIPIIAMTANAFSEDIHAARQAGMNEHLSKPIEIEKMYRTLKRWME